MSHFIELTHVGEARKFYVNVAAISTIKPTKENTTVIGYTWELKNPFDGRASDHVNESPAEIIEMLMMTGVYVYGPKGMINFMEMGQPEGGTE
jgi:hypothetical protein